jgi:hypothetical protein
MPAQRRQEQRLKDPLSVTHPQLAAEWHPTKNGNLRPEDVAAGSNQKAWWKCPKAEDHEWEATVKHRINGTGCPYCSNRKVAQSNCLSTTHPELAAQWHSTKNGNLRPENVNAGSEQKVWWKCTRRDDHEWEAAIKNRTRGAGCPYCSGRKAGPSNCLATLYPEIAKQWHPTKNRGLRPEDVTPFSNKRIWWKCPVADDHEWESTVGNRTAGRGCPCCGNDKAVKSNCLATTHPELAVQWHPVRNGSLTPEDITAGSNKKVWWKCPVADDHEWDTTISNRTMLGNGCPYCCNRKVVKSNSLATMRADLAAEWHAVKNGHLRPEDVTAFSKAKVWWSCPVADDHEWEATVYDRASGSGCPCCRGFRVVRSNCLSTTHPELAEQWHPTKNGDLRPEHVTAGSGKKAWWKCPTAYSSGKPRLPR